MKTVSTTAENIINSSGARWFTKFTLNGTDYINAISTFTLTNTINTNGNVSVGTTCASTLQFTIFDNELSLENEEITLYSGVALTYDDDEEPLTYEWLPIGVFKVVGATTEGNKTTFTAYDRMYYLLEQTYEPTVTFPTTNLLVLEDICTQVGISLATTISSPKTVSFDANVTMREMVGYMAMLECANAVFDEDGNLELRWYASADYELTADRWYSDGFTLDTSSSTTITRVDCTVTVDSVTTTLTSGSGSLPITLNNPYMTQTILDGIYTAVNSLSANCQATTIKFLGDLRLEVGDIVSITDNDTTVSRPIMNIENKFDGGLITTTNTYAFSETTTSVGNVTPITSKINKLSAEIIETNELVVTASEDIAELEGNVYVEGTTTINGGNIATDTIKADSIDVDDLFAQSITATNFNITGGSVHITTSSEESDVIRLTSGNYTVEITPSYNEIYYEDETSRESNEQGSRSQIISDYDISSGATTETQIYPGHIVFDLSGTESSDYLCRFYYDCIQWISNGTYHSIYYPTSSGTFALTSDITTALADYVTSSDLTTTLSSYVTSTNLTTILSDYALTSDIPTKLSDLTDDVVDGVYQKQASTSGVSTATYTVASETGTNVCTMSLSKGLNIIRIGVSVPNDVTNTDFTMVFSSTINSETVATGTSEHRYIGSGIGSKRTVLDFVYTGYFSSDTTFYANLMHNNASSISLQTFARIINIPTE